MPHLKTCKYNSRKALQKAYNRAHKALPAPIVAVTDLPADQQVAIIQGKASNPGTKLTLTGSGTAYHIDGNGTYHKLS